MFAENSRPFLFGYRCCPLSILNKYPWSLLIFGVALKERVAVAEIKTHSLGLITNGAPAMKSYLNDPWHWRERAEKTCAKAAWFWKDSEKQRMMRIADEYDRLADRAERSVELLDKK
jgi:hypothetical protein